jgi:hypothetical protein
MEPREPRLGRLPAVALCASLGLLACAGTQALSRATLAPPGILFWAGLLLIVVPVFWRLSSPRPTETERLALVTLLGLALYGVKVVRDSFLYGFSDEPVHAFNADQIAGTHHLFSDNPILPTTAHYPGLEGATSALMTMSGLSSFSAGLIVVGAARLMLILGLFQLFRAISGSARMAGLGVAIYVGNFNFLYFSAQFSYESLSLPLLIVVVLAVTRWISAPRDEARAWSVPIVLATAAVVVTHHLTSYALVVTLAALAIFFHLLRDRTAGANPWPFAAVALGLTVTWLVVVASTTVGYLEPVIDRAFTAAIDTVTGGADPRGLFESAEAADVPDLTPLAARGVAFAAIAILALGLALSIREVLRRYRGQPLVLLFCAAAVGFFATLPLRFVPEAWETGNRASGFLFIGLAFVVAHAVLRDPIARMTPMLRQSLLTGLLAVVCMGGVIAGWPWDAHLDKPVRITADGRTLESETVGLGRWVRDHVPDGRFAAPAADARILLSPGGAWAQAGRDPGIEEILFEPELAGWHFPVLREEGLRYLVADARDRGEDGLRGYAFSVRPPAGRRDELQPPESALKFEQLYATARILDSGRIAVYDLAARK